MSIDDTTLISRSPLVPAVNDADGMVVLSIDRGRFLRLDDIGRDIWERIENPRSLAELVDELTCDYDAPRASIAADVVAWVAAMAETGLVRLA